MSDTQVSFVNEEVVYEKPGFLKRILWVLTSPGKLMANLAEKPRVLFGLILSALSMDVLYLSRMEPYKDTLRSSMQATAGYTESLTGQTLTAEMIEESLPASVTQGLLLTPPSLLITLLFSTLIFFAIFKIMGGQGKFKAYLSVAGYSYVITALYILTILVVSLITGTLEISTPLTSLASLAPTDMKGTFLYGVLKGLEVFSIWNYAVMAIGFTAVSKLKKKYVYSAVAVVFVIGLLITGASEMALGSML